MNSEVPVKRTRVDIQILRAISIIAVVAFHVWSDALPNGYLGVDIFFVISGYLMAKTLNFGDKNSVFTTSIVLSFYQRRIKRLIPIYLIVILVVVSFGSIFLIPSDFRVLQTNAMWALIFGNNMKLIFAHENYFHRLNQFSFLLHTWSLSVEAQYYLVAPFLLRLLSKHRPILYTAIVISVSVLFHILNSDTIKFNLMPARLWQLLSGAITLLIEKKLNKNNLNKYYSYIFQGAIVMIILSPNLHLPFLYTFLRFLTTLLTALTLFAKTSIPRNNVSWLYKIGILIGDASYSIYLVHWPVIIFFKYYNIIPEFHPCIVLIVITVVSMFQYYCIEKQLQQWTIKNVLIFCATLYCITIFVIATSNRYITHDTIVLKNDQIGDSCNELHDLNDCQWDSDVNHFFPSSKRPFVYACSYKGNGTANVFVVGNSFALRQFSAIKIALRGRFKNLWFTARPMCTTFDRYNAHLTAVFKCDQINGSIEAFLKAHRPDVMIITQMLSSILVYPTETREEKIQNISNYFKTFAKYTKVIFHIENHQTWFFPPPQSIARFISIGSPINSLSMSMTKYNTSVNPPWKIMLEAMQDCPTCHPIWIRQALCQKQHCFSYDTETRLSLFCDAWHLSSIGTSKIVSALEIALDSVLN